MTKDVTFTAACDGTKQKYVLVFPEAFKAGVPHDVLIALHGHGSNRWQFVRDPRDECRAARDVGNALDMLYHAAPVIEEYDRILFGHHLRRPTDAFSRADVQFCRELLPVVRDAKRVLSAAVTRAKRNGDRLRDLVVAARFLETLYGFGAGGRPGAPGWGRGRRGCNRSGTD